MRLSIERSTERLRAFFFMFIESSRNPKVRQLIQLHERRERDRSGLFLIEGEREIERAVDGGVELHSIFYVGSAPAYSVPAYELSPPLFEKVSYRGAGQLAVAYQTKRVLDDLKGSLFLLIESVEKPGNLGAMLRTCDGAGVDGVILCDPVIDPFNPNVVRASLGALFTVPWAVASLDQSRAFIQERNLPLIAATPDAELSYWAADLQGVIAVGSEHAGLSDGLLEMASQRVSIPMRGHVDSLNVATSAALLLFEAIRQ